MGRQCFKRLLGLVKCRGLVFGFRTGEREGKDWQAALVVWGGDGNGPNGSSCGSFSLAHEKASSFGGVHRWSESNAFCPSAQRGVTRAAADGIIHRGLPSFMQVSTGSAVVNGGAMLITAQTSPDGDALIHFGTIEAPSLPSPYGYCVWGCWGGGLFPFRRQRKSTRCGGDVWTTV